MASWMAHLRIADRLVCEIGALPQVPFIVGNIAPDSGEPNADWSAFTPLREVSHWKIAGVARIERPERFRRKHLDAAQTPGEIAFHLGYYTHLVTDFIWARDVFLPQREQYAQAFAQDPAFVWQIKRDMYDLDHLYLREHPDFRAFKLLAGVAVFPNTYLSYFSESAFEKKIAYIVDFYQNFKGELDRDYPYFTRAEMDRFVEGAVCEILPKLRATLARKEIAGAHA